MAFGHCVVLVLSARLDGSRVFGVLAWFITLLAVVLAWVVFRAETLPGAGRILQSMALADPGAQVHTQLWNAGLSLNVGGLWCGALGAMACLVPNSNRIGDYLLSACQSHSSKAAFIAGASSAAVVFMLVMNITCDQLSAASLTDEILAQGVT